MLFNLETYDTNTNARIQGYENQEIDAVDVDDACEVLRADLADYPEYVGRDAWGVRPVSTAS